jgi:hypothetical protein
MIKQPDMMVHDYNPSYSGGGDYDLKPARAKVSKTLFKNKPRIVVHACGSNYSGGRSREIVDQSQPGQGSSERPYLKNKQKRKRTGDVAQVVGHLPSKMRP